MYQCSTRSADHVIAYDINIRYNSCFGKVTIFCYNLTIFSKFKRYNLVQDFWELRACHAAVGPPPQLVPHHNWSPRTICGKLYCHRSSPRPSMAAMGGPLCRKWSPSSKPEKQWLQLQIDR